MFKSGTAVYWSSDENGARQIGRAINLSSGEVIVWASEETQVKAGSATVTLKPGSSACVSLTDGVLCVRNIYEDHASGVEVTSNQHTVKLNAGGEVIAETKPGSLDKHLSTESGLARRQVSISKGHQEAQMMLSEVSFTSLVNSDQLLHDVFYSQQAEKLGFSKRITKLMAAMSVATAGHGPYQNGGKK